MRQIVSLLSMLLLFSVLAFGQTQTVSGTVRDEKGAPIPFATVTETGTANATQANEAGVFSLTIRQGGRLTVTSSGFTGKTYTPTPGSQVVSLVAAESNLQEVIVSTALGVRRQPKELGYATATVSNKEVTQANAVNIQSGLTGKVSGLNIATTNNGVFQNTRITLRGIRSLTGNNQPLLVLDGSPVDLSMLSRLNPNDVDDISILKGASAAALYGPEGVNGVIFVNTIKGSRSGAPQIKVSNSVQFESVLFLPKFQKQFGSGSGVDANGIGVYDPFENQQYGDEFDGSRREIGRPYVTRSQKPDGSFVYDTVEQTEIYQYNKNGRRNFFETGTTVQTDVSYSAKNFYLSAQDANISGTLGGDKNRRTTFRMNAGNEYGKFSTNYQVSFTRQKYNVASFSPYWEVFNTPGHIDLGKYKNWRDPYSPASPNHYFNEYYQNPYFIKDKDRSAGTNDDIFGQIEFNYKASSWLGFTYRASATAKSSDFKNTQEAFTFSSFAKDYSHKYNASNDIKANVSDGESRSTRLTSLFFINAQKDIGDFNIDGLFGHSFSQNTGKSVNISGTNLIIPTLYNIANRTGEANASEGNSLSRLIGVFGKVTFGYKNFAFVEVTGRNDWDSRLPQDALSFFYPGVSASLVLSDAIPALKNSSSISYLKLRGSISKSGNVNINPYSLEQNFGVAGGFPYGNLPGFQGSSSVNNPAIKPEFVNSKEVGVEVSFLRNRISIEATAYTQNNTNQILNIQTSRATGVTDALVNAADFDNKGIEFDLRLTPVVKLGRDFRINFKGNLSLMDSRINSVYQGLDEIGNGNGNFAIVGYPAFMFKLTDYKRDDQGRIIVDRVSGYPSLDPNVKMFGNTMPNTIIGLNPSFSWKGLTLSATADYRGGHQVYHGIGPDMDFTGSSARSGTNGRQRFVVPNSVYFDGTKYVPNTDILTANGGYGFYEASNTNRGVNSNYLTSAAAWKIRELAINYEIPASLLRGTRLIKTASVALTGRNLFTFLPASNQWTDPEFNTSTGNAIGVNNSNILPPNRLYGFNVVLGF
jgi:TonB-linked SusC/RagA family outer membrane protein